MSFVFQIYLRVFSFIILKKKKKSLFLIENFYHVHCNAHMDTCTKQFQGFINIKRNGTRIGAEGK